MRLGEIARRDLVTHQADRLRIRADEGDPGLGDSIGEAGIFREKAISRMDGVRTAGQCSRDDLGTVEMGRNRCSALELHRLARHPNMLRPPLDMVIDGDGGDAERIERADHAHRDLAPVGDQDLLEWDRRVRHAGTF